MFCFLPSESGAAENLYTALSPEWGGHLRFRGNVTWQAEDSLYQPVGTGAYYDASGEFRLKNKLFLGQWGVLETHYEAVLAGGDTRRKGRELAALSDGMLTGELQLTGVRPINDDRRFMDLTGVIDESDSYALYHRLDRLSLTLNPEWGNIRIGRQALTWGNGMLFNPMDLFNPFSPTDIVRDYKVGDDMVTAQFSVDSVGSFQFLYIPRRNPENSDVEWDSSALAGKLRFSGGTTEFDIAVGRNYENYVIGLGSAGYIGNAAWRADAVWTFLPAESDRTGYAAFVANLDYSWIWWQKNFYGVAELYYNGLGEDAYADALSDPDLTAALERGEIFALGKLYLAGQFNVELHPLFNFYLTAITNFRDPSGVLQPRCVWSVTENTEAILGGISVTADRIRNTADSGFPARIFPQHRATAFISG
ncbi:hypothetical protein DENIS_0531 [Desulfonema ishimotonii]|uniref:Alginate export domain-containing protein n=1 Tax=Desulfonema ishimotonii TaxID=45657 RepID=A0A401FRJ5_9BACT|nr:hypothetical protein [Desulfonema ishimotonii]GBC59592.1 hypothetical protein DENIS_0531 [Desulfonema ishimotonii]